MTDSLHLAAVDLAVANGDLDVLARIAAEIDSQDESRRARLEGGLGLTNAAIWYAEAGVPIFPLQPRSKVPLAGSRGFKDATTGAEQVHTWWAENPTYNIGMPTGIIADVIDVDGTVGVIAVAPYVESIRQRAIGIVSTPRPGGLHYWVPPGAIGRNSASLVLDHVDTRGAGGYVVLPPSVTDDHGPGRRYTWLRPLVVT